jgi:hypothetical protein
MHAPIFPQALSHVISKKEYSLAQQYVFKLTLSDPMSDLARNYDFPVPGALPYVVQTLANR